MAQAPPPISVGAGAARRPLAVLILDDDPAVVEAVVRELRAAGFEPTCRRVESEAAFAAALSPAPDLILADDRLRPFAAEQACALLRTRGLEIPLILLCGEARPASPIPAGVDDYVDKDRLSRVGWAASRALERQRLRDALQLVNEKPSADDVLRRPAEQLPVGEALRLRDRAIQAATQGILITDPSLPDNPIVFASRGFEQLTGYTNAEIMGRNCRFLQGPDSDPAAVARVRDAIAAGTACTVELVNYRKDGTRFWNELSISPILNDAGRLTHFVGVQVDVSGRRQLEERFRQSQKMDAFGRLAGGVAHDFNNLLTVILGCCEVLDEDVTLNGSSRELAQAISQAGERAAALTGQLLAFSRQQFLQPRVLNLNDVTARIVTMLEHLIGEDIEVTAALAPQPWPVKVDKGQIEQVLMNLAVNARDAMPQGGQLTLSTANQEVDESYAQVRPELKPGEYVVLAVSDTGCGMGEATRNRVFEPFFTTKELGKGAGLGLATVFGIVKQSGGHIAVYSEPGKGTTFTLYFPRDATAAAPAPEPAPVPTPARGSETVLVVEDAEMVRTIVSRTLAAQGYTVLQACNGAEAVDVCREHAGEIHLVLTDVVMPEMSGRQLAETLRGPHPHLKLLFMSGFTDDSIVRHGVLTDQSHFIQKPFTSAALIRKVRDVLDQNEPSAL